jgi:hypothetical protein
VSGGELGWLYSNFAIRVQVCERDNSVALHAESSIPAAAFRPLWIVPAFMMIGAACVSWFSPDPLPVKVAFFLVAVIFGGLFFLGNTLLLWVLMRRAVMNVASLSIRQSRQEEVIKSS